MTYNPYDVLGVSKNTSIDQIKSQFRKLALEFHPDKNKSKKSEAKFKEISEAYEILSDPKKREDFDKKESGNYEETQKTRQSESARSVWWRQLKTMGRELLKLLQKYAQRMNERSSHSQKTHKSRIFGYETKNDYYEKSNFNDDISNWVGTTNYVGSKSRTRKQKRKQENFEDPWVNASEEDSRLANKIFGVQKPRKKARGRSNNDYGFNMEDVFDL